MAIVTGTNGDDTELRGTNLADQIYGLAGVDALYGEAGDDRLNGGEGDDVLEGGAGIDTASFGSSSTHNQGGVTADLASGTAVGAAPVGNDRLSGIENLEGTRYNDRLAGDGGANALAGGHGADVLEGRGGADRFVYGQNYESPPAAPDLILDFSRKQGDRIDLSAVDANDQVTDDQAFNFIGKGAFSAAGQARFFFEGDHTVIELNTTDATGAEAQIELAGKVNLVAGDFFL